jgi:hypothetical protein
MYCYIVMCIAVSAHLLRGTSDSTVARASLPTAEVNSAACLLVFIPPSIKTLHCAYCSLQTIVYVQCHDKGSDQHRVSAIAYNSSTTLSTATSAVDNSYQTSNTQCML